MTKFIKFKTLNNGTFNLLFYVNDDLVGIKTFIDSKANLEESSFRMLKRLNMQLLKNVSNFGRRVELNMIFKQNSMSDIEKAKMLISETNPRNSKNGFKIDHSILTTNV